MICQGLNLPFLRSQMYFPVAAYTVTSALGVGLSTSREAIAKRCSGLRHNDFWPSELDTWIGRCDAADDYVWEGGQQLWESRNNALAAIGLAQDGLPEHLQALRERYGADRIGVAVGTSTSSVGRTEEAYRDLDDERMPPRFRQYRVHNPSSPAEFVAAHCELGGPAITVSTACSSSAKVFATAARWLDAGIVDAVLLGGVDSLCLSVLHGFYSLELTSRCPCRPFDVDRDGISIGEAAAFALLVRPADGAGTLGGLRGYGESSDAHHMSHPHPEGLGATLSMSSALKRAELAPADIDYLNLHGTASRANDLVESRALASLFPGSLFASSTKGWTGHTLGAAGILEALLAFDVLATGLAPGTLNLAAADPELAFEIQTKNRQGSFDYVLTNSFGFGGSNCSLIFGRSP